ncbi:hypothetical protein FDP41_013782 [Naegleria fowleri]|uniref:Uncharacterized protein n=1 Tax=Naegleria fowleri TaxID=5763 RepID=A0A6A5BQ19_NAEFO|nr:uncharacterized protein FDP41_013782 [Naegleria fowleri]KAF0980133.1 hypothetical protein FDP41_013782 [Naegleria fowleri]
MVTRADRLRRKKKKKKNTTKAVDTIGKLRKLKKHFPELTQPLKPKPGFTKQPEESFSSITNEEELRLERELSENPLSYDARMKLKREIMKREFRDDLSKLMKEDEAKFQLSFTPKPTESSVNKKKMEKDEQSTTKGRAAEDTINVAKFGKRLLKHREEFEKLLPKIREKREQARLKTLKKDPVQSSNDVMIHSEKDIDEAFKAKKVDETTTLSSVSSFRQMQNGNSEQLWVSFTKRFHDTKTVHDRSYSKGHRRVGEYII